MEFVTSYFGGMDERLLRALSKSMEDNDNNLRIYTQDRTIFDLSSWKRYWDGWDRPWIVGDKQRFHKLVVAADMQFAQMTNLRFTSQYVGFLDADMVALRNADKLEELMNGHEIGLCIRDWPQPINCGLIVMRTDVMADIANSWEHQLRLLSTSPSQELMIALSKYGGPQQAVIGLWAEQNDDKIGWLRCQDWNCEDSCWATAKNPAFVHVKSVLRDAILGRKPADVWPVSDQIRKRLMEYFNE